MQDINEMKNLIIQSFESKGILSSLRAQIRSSVFKAIEEEGQASNSKQASSNAFGWENQKALGIKKDVELLFIAKLFEDFCLFYGLDYTANVFAHETSLNTSNNFEDMGDIISKKIQNKFK